MSNKQHYSVACAMIVAMFLLCSCALIHRRKPAGPELSVNEYFPHNAGAKYTYRIIIDKQSTERTFQWKGADEVNGKKVYIFTDGRGYTKGYELTPDAVHLRGISLENQTKPSWYRGDNVSLKSPIAVGNEWTINASVETDRTKIHQSGRGKIVRLEKCDVAAGSFDAVKVLYNITSEYFVKETGEKSAVLAQYIIWYGKGVGPLKQIGTSLVEKEDHIVYLEQELIKYEKGRLVMEKSAEVKEPVSEMKEDKIPSPETVF